MVNLRFIKMPVWETLRETCDDVVDLDRNNEAAHA
jgi:hypothetical protein